MQHRVERDAQQGVRTVLPHGRVALAPHTVPVPGRCTVGGGPQRRERAPRLRLGGVAGSFLEQVGLTSPCVEWRNLGMIGD